MPVWNLANRVDKTLNRRTPLEGINLMKLPKRCFGKGFACLCWWLSAASVRAENTNSMVKPPVPLPGGLGVTRSSLPLSNGGYRYGGMVRNPGPFQLLHGLTPMAQTAKHRPPTFEFRQSAPLKAIWDSLESSVAALFL
jgi:hypothetical protein